MSGQSWSQAAAVCIRTRRLSSRGLTGEGLWIARGHGMGHPVKPLWAQSLNPGLTRWSCICEAGTASSGVLTFSPAEGDGLYEWEASLSLISQGSLPLHPGRPLAPGRHCLTGVSDWMLSDKAKFIPPNFLGQFQEYFRRQLPEHRNSKLCHF